MSSSVNISRKMVSFDKAEQFDGFSKVVIIVSDEIEYSAGTDTGRTLTLNCPWGTQEIANNILQSIKGFQYQPMTAENALVDPSVEIGDGISANGVYSGVYSLETKFNSNLPTTVSAPADEELYEEHTYIPKAEREVTRKFLDFQSRLIIQDGKISAEVEERKSDTKTLRSELTTQSNVISAKVGKYGGDYKTFGWNLRGPGEVADHPNGFFELVANGYKQVMFVDEKGLSVNGKITATSGEIGGFSIEPNYLSYNGHVWGGTNTIGGYLGPQGLQLGRNFKVDMSGNLEAASGKFTGTVYAGNVEYGDHAGYFSGGGIASGSIYGNRLVGNTITTAYTSGGINASLGYADFANGVFNGWNRAPQIACDQISASQILMGGRNFGASTISYVDANGNTHALNVVTWAWR